MMLVDSHCHLDFKEFSGDLDEVIERGQQVGVARFVTICTHLDHLDRTLDIAERYDAVYCAAGMHPHEAEAADDWTVDRLADLAMRPKLVGLGETGLDYHYDHSPRPAQQASFRRHIRAARETGLPLIVHTREADADTIRILAEEGAGQGGHRPLRGLIHCFSGGRELAEKAVEFGFYISVSGIITFKAAGALRDIVADIPMDRLLVETDAPYLAPVPKRGKRNEPALVAHTAAKLAEIKGVSAAAIGHRTTENFFALFDRVPAAAMADPVP